MKSSLRNILIIFSLSLSACFWDRQKSPEAPSPPTSQHGPETLAKGTIPTSSTPSQLERSLEIFAKHFEQSDSVHREAWWVLTGERWTPGRSPFGKVQRAILSHQNIKLTNKSAFRCDRYIFKRDVMGPGGYPQKAEIYEKCSEKVEAKKIADFYASAKSHIVVTFYPENLEEILGLGATVLNKSIKCTIKGNENEQLERLSCTDWAQERSKDQMIRLDEYDYQRAGKNLIRLRGKVYENLSDTRKIEADVPMEGKIVVKETELYPPEPSPIPAPAGSPVGSPSGAPKKERPPNAPPLTLPSPPEGAEAQVSPAQPQDVPEVSTIPAAPNPALPSARESAEPIDPDVMMMQNSEQQMENPHAR